MTPEADQTERDLMVRAAHEMGRDFAERLSSGHRRTLAETEDQAAERMELLETQVHVLFAMVYSIGRGLSSVLDVLGLDHEAACAELTGEPQ